MLKMDLDVKSKKLYVYLNGFLNRNTTYKINNYLLNVILKHKIKYLVLDFNNLKSIDKYGIESLLNVKYAIKDNKGMLYLKNDNNIINKQIKHLHLKPFIGE